MLTLIESLGARKSLYKCACGKVVQVFDSNVVRGHTKSCGCFRRLANTERFTTHGHKSGGVRTVAYVAWVNMKSRCNNSNRKDAKNYIGRGIGYCAEWESFEVFLKDMGEPPEGTSLDRKNNNEGYSKNNCRWATATIQNLNKRNCTAYTYNGKTQTISEWGRELGINHVTLHKRLQRGISIDIAFAAKGYLQMNRNSKVMPTNDATTGLLRVA